MAFSDSLDQTLIEDRYRPVAVLGTGGMGQVYEAFDQRLARSVALKLVHTTDTTSAARLRAEATVLAGLRHPNLVTVFDAGEHDGRPFIVTELVRGQSLRQRMDEGLVPADEVARIGAQIASALVCAHDSAIVHRDLTPGNVLLADETGDARLIDFGIAVTEHALGLTSTGMVIGTPAYLSPEQVEGRTATTASDIYSLGLVLLEALQGHKAFPGTPTESASARLVSDVPMPDDLAPGWVALLVAMTQRDPDLRPGAAVVARRLGEPPISVPGRSGPAIAAAAATRTDDRTRIMAPPDRTMVAFDRPTAAGPIPTGNPTTPARRRRWPFVVAGLALLAGVLVLAVGAIGTDEQTPGVDPPTSVAPAAPTTVATTAVVTPPTGATSPSTTAPGGNQGAGSAQRGQGKAKGKDG